MRYKEKEFEVRKILNDRIIRGKVDCYINIENLEESNDVKINKGLIDSLKKIKENVLEVPESSECGIFVAEFDAWKQGDTIKAFELIPKKKSTF